MIQKSQLTPEERAAVNALEAVARKWPPSLWLFSASGTLCVMKCGPGGERMMTPGGGYDPEYHTPTAVHIPNDGGDW